MCVGKTTVMYTRYTYCHGFFMLKNVFAAGARPRPR